MAAYRSKRNYYRYSPFQGGFRNFAKAGMALASAYRMRPKGSRSMAVMKKRVTDGVGVTSQYDKTLIYRKKRMPYRKKKAWINFSKKVRAVLEKEVGTKTAVFNTSINDTNVAGKQGILTIGMYTAGGLVDGVSQNFCGLRDLLAVVANDPVDITGKLKFKSAVLDVTFTASTENVIAQELDIYELWFNGKECPYTSVNGIYGQAQTNTGTISGAGTQITITDRGVTPFDLPNAFSIGHFSVGKKMKYFLEPGKSCTYQIRDPRTFYFNKADIGDDVGSLAPSKKCCRILYAIFKPVIGGAFTGTVFAGATRKYSYSVIEQNATKDNIIT